MGRGVWSIFVWPGGWTWVHAVVRLQVRIDMIEGGPVW